MVQELFGNVIPVDGKHNWYMTNVMVGFGNGCNMKFKQGDLVEIHSLGPSYGDQTFEGKICGVSVDWGDSDATIWIVECNILDLAYAADVNSNLIPGPPQDRPFTHITMPQACLRKR